MKKSILIALLSAVISPMVLLAGSTSYDYSATLNVESSGNGKVYASTSSTTAGTSASATTSESSTDKSKSFTLYAHAVADEGYEFSKWSDGTTGNPQAVSFSLTSSSSSATKNLTATFVKKALPEFSVTFSAPIGGGYTVNGIQVSSAYSLTQTEALETTLVATPSAGNRFYGWYTLNGNAKEYFSYSASVSKSFASSVTVGVDFISESDVVKVATFAEANAAMSSDAIIVEIPSGTTLIVPSGSTLTVPAGKKLEVNGRLYVIGTLEVNGIVGGNGAVARAWKVITQAAEVKIPFPAGTDGVSGTDYGIHTVDGTAGKYLVTSVNDSSAVITDTSSFEEKYIVVVENKASGKIYYSEPSTSKPVGVLCTVAREKALNWIDGVSTTVYTDYATLLSAAATPAGAAISGNDHSFKDTNKLAVLTGAAGTVTYNHTTSSSTELGFAVDLAGTSITLTPSSQWNSKKLVRAFNGSFSVTEKVMNTNFSVYNCSGNLEYLSLSDYVTAVYLYDSPNIAVNFKDKKAESKGALWFCGGGIYKSSKTPFNTTVTDKKSFNKVFAGTFDSKMDPREYLYDTNKVYAEQDPPQTGAWFVKTTVTDPNAGQVIVNGKESSLAEAIANAADNDVIKLQKDIVIDSELTVSASGVRIDLNGWKLSGDKSIVNNGDLEIIDENGNGQIDVSIINNGTLLLSSAVYNGKIVLNRGFCYFLNGRFNGGVEVAADVANAADIAEVFGGTYALTSYTQGDNSHALVTLCKNGYLLNGAIAQIPVSHVTSSSFASYSIDALNETERALYTRNAARESYTTREEWIEFNKIKASCVMFSGWAIDCAIKFDRDIKANDLAVTANISPIPIDVDVNIAANIFYSALLQAMRGSGLASAPYLYGAILPNGGMEGQLKFALGNVSAQNGTLCHIEMRLANGVKNLSGPKDWSYTTFVVTASEKLVLGAGSNKAMIRPETGAATFYAKLADAVVASNGGTVLLAADSTEAETITLPAVGTYTIDPYGFAYANKTVVVAEGLELESAREIDSAYSASQQKAVVYTVRKRGLSGAGTEADPFLIKELDDLVLFRDSVNAGETKYNAAGVWVALGADINMASVDWSVNIGDAADTSFDGIFDGKGKKILNLNSVETAKDPWGYICTGLFGCIAGNAQIKNLTLENVNITAEFTGNNVAALVGFAYNCSGAIDNVTVKNVAINAANATGVGAIVGYDYYSPALKVTNCTVDGTSIKGAAYVGGVIGYASTKIELNNNTVKNLTLNGTASVGGVAGIMLAGGSASGNTVEKVQLSATGDMWANSVGLVAGTITTGSVTVTGTTATDCAVKDLIGGILVEKPTSPIEKIQVQLGDSYFTTLDAAINAAKAGDTIKLLTNVGTDAAIVVNKEVAVDLNGKTIAATENDKVGDGVFCVVAGGELTINDSLGTGVINGVGDNDYNIAIWANGGKVIINGGNFTNVGATDKTDPNAHFDLIYAKNGGEVIINGGNFECETPEFTLNSHDTNKGNITVNGGTFVGFDPRNNAAETAGTSFMAESKYTFADGANYIVVTPKSYVLNGVASNSAAVDKIDAALAGAVKITKVDGAYVATAEYTFEVTEIDILNPEKSSYELTGGKLRPGKTVAVKYIDLATGDESWDKPEADTVIFKLVIK